MAYSSYERAPRVPFRTDTYSDSGYMHYREEKTELGYSQPRIHQEQVGYVLNTNGANLDQNYDNAQRRSTFDTVGRTYGQGPKDTDKNGNPIPGYVREAHWSKPFERETPVYDGYQAYKDQDVNVYQPANQAYNERKRHLASLPEPTKAEPRWPCKPPGGKGPQKQFYTDRDGEADLYRHAKEAADATYL